MAKFLVRYRYKSKLGGFRYGSRTYVAEDAEGAREAFFESLKPYALDPADFTILTVERILAGEELIEEFNRVVKRYYDADNQIERMSAFREGKKLAMRLLEEGIKPEDPRLTEMAAWVLGCYWEKEVR